MERLSTIEEVSNETDISIESAGAYLHCSDKTFQQVFVAVADDFTRTIEPEAEPVIYDDVCGRLPLQLLTIPEDRSPPAL
eukprot:5557567-Lingulodinium_polyedra.AAC.1